MNNFQDNLAESHAASDWWGWEEIYRKAFPDFAAMVDHRKDGEHQRAGIDRSVILENSKQLLIDEKVRGKNKITGKIYDDIALEYLSDEQRNVPGWVCKPLLADYIAYAILPLGKCYLLPVIQLQAAWAREKNIWLKTYRTIRAVNPSWVTLSLPVPPEVLFPAIGRCLRVDFEPQDELDRSGA